MHWHSFTVILGPSTCDKTKQICTNIFSSMKWILKFENIFCHRPKQTMLETKTMIEKTVEKELQMLVANDLQNCNGKKA